MQAKLSSLEFESTLSTWGRFTSKLVGDTTVGEAGGVSFVLIFIVKERSRGMVAEVVFGIGACTQDAVQGATDAATRK